MTTEPENNRGGTGQFEKGKSGNPAGRTAGTPNKTTAMLKEAILLAAEQTGQDGLGKGGLTGYLRHVAASDVKAFAALLGKVLPLQVTGAEGGAIGVVFQTVYEERKR